MRISTSATAYLPSAIPVAVGAPQSGGRRPSQGWAPASRSGLLVRPVLPPRQPWMPSHATLAAAYVVRRAVRWLRRRARSLSFPLRWSFLSGQLQHLPAHCKASTPWWCRRRGTVRYVGVGRYTARHRMPNLLFPSPRSPASQRATFAHPRTAPDIQ